MSLMNKLPVYGNSNTYLLHFILGMTSKNDDGVIDERSTWAHVTDEKLKEVVQLLNLQAKQHKMLGHDPYYEDRTVEHKLARDENAEFDSVYIERQKAMELVDFSDKKSFDK